VNFSNRRLLFGLFMFVLAVVVGIILIKSPPTEWQSAKQFGQYIQGQGLAGLFMFFLSAAAATSLGFPRQFFAFAAGFTFGIVAGVMLSSIAAIAGCSITFFVSRYCIADRVRRRYPSLVNNLNDLLVDHVFLKIFVLRIQPLGTNLITNLCAGVSNINASVFFVSSWFGYLPQMFVFALLGAGVRIDSYTHTALSLFSLLISLVIGYWLYKRIIEKSCQ